MKKSMRLLAIKHQTTTGEVQIGTVTECVYWRLNIKPQHTKHQPKLRINASIGD